MMDYKEFKEMVAESTNGNIQSVTKENGIVLEGVTVINDSGFSPIVYLESYYEQYKAGRDMDSIIKEITEMLHTKPNFTIDKDYYLNYENVKDKIYAALINKEANAEMLDKLAYKEFEDLAIIYKIIVNTNGNERATIKITKGLMDVYNISVDELNKQAMLNMKHMSDYNKSFTNMFKVLSELVPSVEDEELIKETQIEDSNPMYVLTNQLQCDGAIWFTDLETLKDIHETLKANFYIIPSSVHEVIIIPDNGDMDSTSILDIIAFCNGDANILQPSEKLSDNLYYFDGTAIKVKERNLM